MQRGKRAQTGLGHQACGEGGQTDHGSYTGGQGGPPERDTCRNRLGRRRGREPRGSLERVVQAEAEARGWSGATGGQHGWHGVSGKAAGEVGQDRASRP